MVVILLFTPFGLNPVRVSDFKTCFALFLLPLLLFVFDILYSFSLFIARFTPLCWVMDFSENPVQLHFLLQPLE